MEFTTPTLKVQFTNEFGNKSEVTKDLMDSTIDSVIEAFREALMGFGFSSELVDDYFGKEM